MLTLINHHLPEATQLCPSGTSSNLGSTPSEPKGSLGGGFRSHLSSVGIRADAPGVHELPDVEQTPPAIYEPFSQRSPCVISRHTFSLSQAQPELAASHRPVRGNQCDAVGRRRPLVTGCGLLRS
jgi:hypothetical protein